MDTNTYTEVMNVLNNTEKMDEVIKNATPEQLEQAQKVAENLPDLYASFFMYASKAFRDLFLWKFDDSFGLKDETMTDVIKLKDKTIHIYLALCPRTYNITDEIHKLKRMLKPSDHQMLDRCNSVMLSKVPIFYTDKLYFEHKDKLQNPRMCLLNDSNRCIFLLDDSDDYGISIKYLIQDN